MNATKPRTITVVDAIEDVEQRELQVEAEKQAKVTLHATKTLREIGFYKEAAQSTKVFFDELVSAGFTATQALAIVASGKK